MDSLIATEISLSLLPTSPNIIVTTKSNVTTNIIVTTSKAPTASPPPKSLSPSTALPSLPPAPPPLYLFRYLMLILMLILVMLMLMLVMMRLKRSRLVPRWTLGYAGIGRHPAPTEDHYSPQKATRPNPQPGSASIFLSRCCCILILVTSTHLLRMVVVALPLTHQKGPRRGIFRAQPSLSGGDSPAPTSSQPSSPIESPPPPRDLSS